MSAPPSRPKVTVVPVEPGFAEIMAGGKCVGTAIADFWGYWRVSLFAGPSLRNTDAVAPFTLRSLRAVRADVKAREQWWTE